MAYREVTMIEVKEVLRLWFAGTATKRIAAMLGLDPKTVRRYLGVAREAGVLPGPDDVTEAQGHDGLAGAPSPGGPGSWRFLGAVRGAAEDY